MNAIRKISLLFISGFILLMLKPIDAQAPIPVIDKKHNKWSKIISEVKKASLIINSKVSLFVQSISKTQEFLVKAHTIVSSTILNIKMINQIIKIQKEIENLVTRSLEEINRPRDVDMDGRDDLFFVNKWKHIQILLAIAGQADNVFELFKNVIEGDKIIMDDKGRLKIIKAAYKDAQKIKIALRIQIRRINKEIYAYRKARREVIAFDKLFSN